MLTDTIDQILGNLLILWKQTLTWPALNWSAPYADTHGFIPPVPIAMRSSPLNVPALKIHIVSVVRDNFYRQSVERKIPELKANLGVLVSIAKQLFLSGYPERDVRH